MFAQRVLQLETVVTWCTDLVKLATGGMFQGATTNVGKRMRTDSKGDGHYYIDKTARDLFCINRRKKEDEEKHVKQESDAKKEVREVLEYMEKLTREVSQLRDEVRSNRGPKDDDGAGVQGRSEVRSEGLADGTVQPALSGSNRPDNPSPVVAVDVASDGLQGGGTAKENGRSVMAAPSIQAHGSASLMDSSLRNASMASHFANKSRSPKSPSGAVVSGLV